MKKTLLPVVGVILFIAAIPSLVIYSENLDIIAPLILIGLGAVLLSQKEFIAKAAGFVLLAFGTLIFVAMVGPDAKVAADSANTAVKETIKKGNLFSPLYMSLGLTALLIGIGIGFVLCLVIVKNKEEE